MPEVNDIVAYITKSGAEVPAVVINVNADGTLDLDRTISGYDDVKMAMPEGNKRGCWKERVFT